MPPRYRAGQQVGRWTLEQLLGTGGNSEVWRATSEAGDQVALKIARVRNPDAEPYRRFRDEIEVLATVHDDEGVLPVIDSSLPEVPTRRDPAWLAMPEATPLVQALGASPAIELVVEAMASMASTLTRLAERDVHHRDVKPGNLFRFEGRWVIGDFGLADFPEKEALTESNRRLGPLYFLAPEMLMSPHTAEGGPADVYSLAKTLWVLATGQNFPPPGEQRRDVQGVRLSDGVAHPRIHVLDRLIEAATRHEPASRPSMTDFAGELEAWLTETPAAEEVDMSSLSDRLTSLLGPALNEEARRRELVNDSVAAFQRVYDHLGTVAQTIRDLGLQGNVSIGGSGKQLTSSLLPRGVVTFGSADILWENHAWIPVEAPRPHSAHLWVVVGCEVFSDETADVAAGYLIGAHSFPQEEIWSQTVTTRPGSAQQDLKVDELVTGLSDNLRAAIEAFMAEIERQRES